jgi:hypothetical protein
MKQHTLPVSIRDEKVSLLTKVPVASKGYNEDWIQNLCFNHPEMLPIAEIEPTFNDMVPICRELACPSGSMDLVYVNEYGFIAIGECYNGPQILDNGVRLSMRGGPTWEISEPTGQRN